VIPSLTSPEGKKADLSWLRIADICKLTGFSEPTARKRMQDARVPSKQESTTVWWDSCTGIKAILCCDNDTDPSFQKARLDRLRGDKVAIEVAILEGKLCKKSDVIPAVMSILSELRTKALNLPAEVARELVGQNDERVIQRTLKTKLENLLNDVRTAIEAIAAASSGVGEVDESE
jgi:predicted DNA-binding transcriptional regulator AlpA